MIDYIKLKVASKDDPKRFYRVIAIREDISLLKLGYIIGNSVRAWFEHGFLFRTHEDTYVPTSWLDEMSFYDDYLPMNIYKLSDLSNNFVYEYDTGEGYEFNCTVYEKPYKFDETDIDDIPDAFVIEGKGQGIFENDHGTLWKYLEGSIDPESSEENEEEMMYLPMNMEFDKYGDFDAPLDLDEFIYYDDDLDIQEELIIKNEKEFLGEDNYYSILEEYEDDDDFDDFDDEEFDENIGEFFERSTLALLIFENEDMTEFFKSLNKKHSFRESYEILYEIYSELPDEMSEEYTKKLISDEIIKYL